jgi:hypothetical protein
MLANGDMDVSGANACYFEIIFLGGAHQVDVCSNEKMNCCFQGFYGEDR